MTEPDDVTYFCIWTFADASASIKLLVSVVNTHTHTHTQKKTSMQSW